MCKYIFGDHMKNFDGSGPSEIPAFLKKTGIAVEKATLIDGETIIK